MNKRSRTQLVLGLLLILFAGWLLLSHLQPEWTDWLHLAFEWPLWVIMSGVAFLLIGLIVGNAEMAVPACIVSGIGGILYYQNSTGDWASWSYMWALIPGLAGLGNLLAAAISGNLKQESRGAINTIFVSIILFIIFATIFDGLDILGPYKDYTIIGLLFIFGLWLIVRGIIRKS